eukprot:TRINITY_DN10092_c0_g1_i4.p1 TRINITY_DN10092_c0_g1~~TRINITY_DN10092_c0_g1_i4.p1  ORF type:complete len:406 (+),score=83.57 TRINITY_DN10092_c0_g1_i4:131-1348(+)
MDFVTNPSKPVEINVGQEGIDRVMILKEDHLLLYFRRGFYEVWRLRKPQRVAQYVVSSPWISFAEFDADHIVVLDERGQLSIIDPFSYEKDESFFFTLPYPEARDKSREQLSLCHLIPAAHLGVISVLQQHVPEPGNTTLLIFERKSSLPLVETSLSAISNLPNPKVLVISRDKAIVWQQFNFTPRGGNHPLYLITVGNQVSTLNVPTGSLGHPSEYMIKDIFNVSSTRLALIGVRHKSSSKASVIIFDVQTGLTLLTYEDLGDSKPLVISKCFMKDTFVPSNAILGMIRGIRDLDVLLYNLHKETCSLEFFHKVQLTFVSPCQELLISTWNRTIVVMTDTKPQPLAVRNSNQHGKTSIQLRYHKISDSTMWSAWAMLQSGFIAQNRLLFVRSVLKMLADSQISE